MFWDVKVNHPLVNVGWEIPLFHRKRERGFANQLSSKLEIHVKCGLTAESISTIHLFWTWLYYRWGPWLLSCDRTSPYAASGMCLVMAFHIFVVLLPIASCLYNYFPTKIRCGENAGGEKVLRQGKGFLLIQHLCSRGSILFLQWFYFLLEMKIKVFFLCRFDPIIHINVTLKLM